MRQTMPSSLAITSSKSMPTARREMPCVLPEQPWTNLSDVSLLSLTSKMICFAQVFWVRYDSISLQTSRKMIFMIRRFLVDQHFVQSVIHLRGLFFPFVKHRFGRVAVGDVELDLQCSRYRVDDLQLHGVSSVRILFVCAKILLFEPKRHAVLFYVFGDLGAQRGGNAHIEVGKTHSSVGRDRKVNVLLVRRLVNKAGFE